MQVVASNQNFQTSWEKILNEAGARVVKRVFGPSNEIKKVKIDVSDKKKKTKKEKKNRRKKKQKKIKQPVKDSKMKNFLIFFLHCFLEKSRKE